MNYEQKFSNSPPRIGIVGGGQLGKMLTIAAKQLGYYVIVSDPTPNSPAGQVSDEQLVGDFKDEKIIRELAEKVDYLTFEIELANDEVLHALIQNGKSVNPSPETLGIIRDKLRQKQFLKKYKLPTAPFIEINTKDDIAHAIKKLGYPLVLKARTDAYDGRGNFLIRTKKDIEKGLKTLSGRYLYAEQYIPFKKELAVVIARNSKKETAVYPVVETAHVDGICDTVTAPAPISEKARKNAQSLAKKTMNRLKGAGVFGIEMFLKKDDTVVINEIAPRVHNSGHYTIEACVTSQFEQHIRAITGIPLGSTALLCRAVVMKNILGKTTGSGFPKGLEKALKIKDVSIHMYGKKESRPKRKMGHITVVGDSIAQCLRKANKARRMVEI